MLCVQEPQFSEGQRALRDALALVDSFRANSFPSQYRQHLPEGVWSKAMRCALEAESKIMYECSMTGIGTGFQMTVAGRVKSLYSIHRKMQTKNVPMEQVRALWHSTLAAPASRSQLGIRQSAEPALMHNHRRCARCSPCGHAPPVRQPESAHFCAQVYDSIAIRLVVSDDGGKLLEPAMRVCYQIPPIVRRLWKRIPHELDDYISAPKKSGYQSIHMAVTGPGGVPIEVQVR